MFRFRHLMVLALAGFSMLAVTRPVTAVADTEKDTVTVAGEGRATARPDVMRINAGVEVQRKQPSEAYTAAGAAAKRLVAALRQSGIQEDDIRTTELSVRPDYVPDKYPQIAGYMATQNVEATVRDLGKADTTLDAVANVGDDARLRGIVFDLENSGPALAEARKGAYRDAQAKAKQYAELSGRKLGRVISVEETSTSSPPPVPYMADAAVKAGGAMVSPGRQRLSVVVRAVYELL